MKSLRVLAVALALSLMLGEAYRSWGVGRPVYAWLDDQILGLLLLTGAWLMRQPTVRNRAFFCAAWAFSTGMLYPSFFNKLFEPGAAQPGNFDLGLLTALIGLAFVTAIAGTILSILTLERSK